ncbi:UvrD-helicase domain-containing protein [Pusillimonas sp. DMV24BSW_D]|uniref:UvrD-helicase domain-containing protein n=1 Tax=Neopusillimonas aestuarii TaxID=2716226 RepID=UPI001409C44B|nr:UvrD-helicase domain-containing protein [Pusillimonas sp. DMV24BSW_D]QIM50139.1 UvrD-helicase domain-containing protein [Pusillimonas sp. DMV24BSW_D]
MASQMTDALVRQRALNPEESFLVQAPAGSGKTELLTDRILALLGVVERPEEIVAITFTRKAAAEMHARVLGKLQAASGPEPQAEHARLSWRLARQAMARNDEKGWKLLQYPARLCIRTIDAFCASLVRSMPWMSELGGMPSLCDDAGAHYEAAARNTLDMIDDYEPVAQLVAHLDVDLRAARSLIARMLATRDQWLPLFESGADPDLLQAHLREAIEEDLAYLQQSMPAGWATQLAGPLAEASRNRVEQGEQAFEALATWDGVPFGADIGSLPQWQALADFLLTNKEELRKRLDKRQGFPPGSNAKTVLQGWLDAFDNSNPWVSALADIRQAPLGYTHHHLTTLLTLFDVLRLAHAQLLVQFSQHSEVDFIEISQRALHALGHPDAPSDLLLTLDASISHLLVDEFQDTSETQIRLLQKLTSGWQPGEGRTLFLVGDPMQSIYRFRKAEVGWFLRVQREGLGDIPLVSLQLSTNFRSQETVVEWVNEVFKPLFPQVAHAGLGAIPYTESSAFHAQLDGLGVHVHAVVTGSKDGAPSERSTSATQKTLSLVQEALARRPESGHPVAILVRARAHLQDVVNELYRHGVPCRAVELVSLKSRPVVNDLVQLARALAHPGDRLAWLSILRSPVCGLRLDTLHALFGEYPHKAVPDILSSCFDDSFLDGLGIKEDEALRVRHACAVLLDQQNRSGRMPFAAWLEACWRRLGGEKVYSQEADRADAQSLLQLVERLAPYGGLNPVELEQQIERLYAAPRSTEGAAVEVMTIHKSKGLQFDTVILMGLHQGIRRDETPLMRVEMAEGRVLLGPIQQRSAGSVDSLAEYLGRRERKRADYEIDRLLYVAVTRAREALHLIVDVDVDDEGAVKPPTPNSLLGRLWPAIEAATVSQVQTENHSSERADANVGSSRNGAPPPETWSALARLPRASLTPARPAIAPVSASLQFGARDAWTQANQDEAIAGIVAHGWLEQIGKQGEQVWRDRSESEREQVVQRQLLRAGLFDHRVPEAIQVVCETIECTLRSERGRWLLGLADAYREWALLDTDGRVSVIDLAVHNEAGWLVVDYKTGCPVPGESTQGFVARMRSRYTDQMARYRQSVAALDGRPVQTALYFPRADIWISDSESDSC